MRVSRGLAACCMVTGRCRTVYLLLPRRCGLHNRRRPTWVCWPQLAEGAFEQPHLGLARALRILWELLNHWVPQQVDACKCYRAKGMLAA